MVFVVSQQAAEEYMVKARSEVKRFQSLVECPGYSSEDFVELTRVAWVRATVLSELALPLEVEDRAGDVVLEFQQFIAAVYALQGVFGMSDVVFSDLLEAAEFEVYSRQESQAVADSGTATVTSMLSAGAAVRGYSGMVLAATCVTYEDGGKPLAASAVFEDDRVALFPVYPVEVLRAVQAGACYGNKVRLAKDTGTGRYVLDEKGVEFDETALPDACYGLRVGAVRDVTLGVFRKVLKQLVHLGPLSSQSGYCYLAAVPMVMRTVMADLFQDQATAGELRRLLPNGGQWCSRPATYKRMGKLYHLTSTGYLPLEIPDAARVAMGSIDEEVTDELRGVISRLNKLRKSSVVRRDSVASGFVPTSILGDDSLFTLSVDSQPKSVGFSGVDGVVSIPAASELFQPTGKHSRRGDELVERLDKGGPLSDAYWRKAENRYGVGRCLPAPREERGRLVLLPQTGPGAATTTGEWRSLDVATGWQVARMSLRNVKAISGFELVVGRNAAARLDCSAASVLVVGGVRVPGQATTVWFQTSLTVVTTAPGGSVVMAVPVSGSATGPGWLASTAVAMYNCPFVKSFETRNVPGNDVVTLYDQPQKSVYGLVRTQGQVNLRDVGVVPIKMVSDTGRSGIAVLVVSGSGLRAVHVAGVEIMAKQGTVCVAVDGWNTEVDFHVVAPGKFKVVADFVADPASLEAKLRFSPSSPVMPGVSF